jgi:hypothetical protein
MDIILLYCYLIKCINIDWGKEYMQIFSYKNNALYNIVDSKKNIIICLI